MKRIIIGVVLASIASFAWGAFYWMGPLSANAFNIQPDDNKLRTALKDALPENGTFFVPNPNMDQAHHAKLHEEGPIAMIHFIRDGKPSNMGAFMGFGFLINMSLAAFLAVLLKLSAPRLSGYGKRVGFVALIGLAASVFTRIGGGVWWYHNAAWVSVMFFYDLTIYIIIGLVLAKFVRSE